MVTRAEAIHSGAELGKDYASGRIENEAMADFVGSLREAEQHDKKEHTHLKWDELSAASKSLEENHVLPKLGFEDKAHHERVARVVGTTADAGKNDGERDVVVALGRKDAGHARDVVVLGHDGKYYQAKEVDGGFVRSEKVVADNAEELGRKYKENAVEKPIPKGAEDKAESGDGKQKVNLTIDVGTGAVTSVRDAAGHERRFTYGDQDELTQVQIDGQTYNVENGCDVESNDWSKRTVHTDRNGRLIIDRSYWGNESGMPNEQVCINTDGSIDRFEMGVWSHLEGQQVNKVYAELMQQLKPAKGS